MLNKFLINILDKVRLAGLFIPLGLSVLLLLTAMFVFHPTNTPMVIIAGTLFINGLVWWVLILLGLWPRK